MPVILGPSSGPGSTGVHNGTFVHQYTPPSEPSWAEVNAMNQRNQQSFNNRNAQSSSGTTQGHAASYSTPTPSAQGSSNTAYYNPKYALASGSQVAFSNEAFANSLQPGTTAFNSQTGQYVSRGYNGGYTTGDTNQQISQTNTNTYAQQYGMSGNTYSAGAFNTASPFSQASQGAASSAAPATPVKATVSAGKTTYSLLPGYTMSINSASGQGIITNGVYTYDATYAYALAWQQRVCCLSCAYSCLYRSSRSC